MTNKIVSMQEAIATHVADGMSLAIEGFTAFICFAAGHEIIRQRRRELTLCRLTPDLMYDHMIAAGVARNLLVPLRRVADVCQSARLAHVDRHDRRLTRHGGI